VLVSKRNDAPIVLPAYEVKAMPDRTVQELTDSIAHIKSLQSKALVKKGNLEAIFPFEPLLEKDSAGQPRACLPILRIRF